MVLGYARRRSLIQASAGIALGALVAPRDARAALSAAELARLSAGEVVAVPLDVDLEEGSYFGGTAYAVVHASTGEVSRVLNDPSSYTSILPKTLEARMLAPHGADPRVFLRQGTRSANAAYVLLLRRESQSLLRFWLDRGEPHDIADLWGSFRVQPWQGGACLLTYAALVRLDFGVVKLLFSEAIRRYALSTPGLVRAFVENHPASGP